MGRDLLKIESSYTCFPNPLPLAALEGGGGGGGRRWWGGEI